MLAISSKTKSYEAKKQQTKVEVYSGWRYRSLSTDMKNITSKQLKKNGGQAIMTNKQINTINSYFDSKHMDRKQLEEVLDFDNLTMDEKYIPEIMELLKTGSDEVGENVIKNYVRFVKQRSGTGEITWEELLTRLKDLSLEYSSFGIRVQRFSKYSYWEVFFNHFDITEYEDGNAKLTFNQEYYEDAEKEIAYEFLDSNGIDMDSKEKNVMSQVADKWDGLSEDEKDNMISALDSIYATHYVDKSRMSLSKKMIDKITMSGADLVPGIGLRDYFIQFTGGDSVSLRF